MHVGYFSLFTKKVNIESETTTHQVFQLTIKDCFMVKLKICLSMKHALKNEMIVNYTFVHRLILSNCLIIFGNKVFW